MDLEKLRQDAQYVVEDHGSHPYAVSVAVGTIAILDNPLLVVPEGWSLVKKPELLGKGVPQR